MQFFYRWPLQASPSVSTKIMSQTNPRDQVPADVAARIDELYAASRSAKIRDDNITDDGSFLALDTNGLASLQPENELVQIDLQSHTPITNEVKCREHADGQGIHRHLLA